MECVHFQRLRQIKQLGFSEYSFPSAHHNRYVHSLGCMHTASHVWDTIVEGSRLLKDKKKNLERFRHALRLAALLHDVGHGPLSHTSESVMPLRKKLKLPPEAGPPEERATHEDYTLKTILDSGLSGILSSITRGQGFSPIHIASLIHSGLNIPDDFFLEEIEGVRVDFRPLLSQIISSEMDADRMDYLRRDSYHAGVSYGQFDYEWLASHLSFHIQEKKAYLTLGHRALYSFEDFLISRYHMFLMVYFHHRSVIFDEMLKQYFLTSDGEYQLPEDIERFIDCHDAHLYECLRRSKNPWARRIVERAPYQMLIEIHSGIPPTASAARAQEKLLTETLGELKQRSIDTIETKSTSELSKYFRKPALPIFVRYFNYYNRPSHLLLEKCTDLFNRYQEKRSITRVYVSPESYRELKKTERDELLL